MRYSETACKTALSPSALPGLDYTLNPYRGCEHGCLYCYAPSTLRYAGPEPWGSFVQAKANLPAVLERELRRKKKGTVGLSTVTDPYQPLERKLRLTRSCLEVLRAKAFPVSVQTKSALVLRDLDVLAGYTGAEVGITITALDGGIASLLEPGASSPGERLRAISELSRAGVGTWAFVGPLIPGLVEEKDLAPLFHAIKDAGASHALVDRLRLKPGIGPRLQPLVEKYSAEVLDEAAGRKLLARALAVGRELGLRCAPAFGEG